MLTINGKSLSTYDEDFFAIYLTLYPELTEGYRYWTDGLYLSHDGKTFTDSTAYEVGNNLSQIQSDDEDDLLLFSEPVTVRKCSAGNKLCGKRCIPKEYKCHAEDITKAIEIAEKQTKSKLRKILTTVGMVSAAAAVAGGIALYLNRDKVYKGIENATNRIAIDLLENIVKKIETTPKDELTSLKQTELITGQEMLESVKQSARGLLTGEKAPKAAVAYAREFAHTKRFQRFVDRLMNNDELRSTVVTAANKAIQFRGSGGKPPEGGMQKLAADLLTKDNAQAIAYKVRQGLTYKVRKSKIWQFLTRPIKNSDGSVDFAENNNNYPMSFDPVEFVSRLGVITQDMENAPQAAIQLIWNDLFPDYPLTAVGLISTIAAIYSEELSND